MHFGACARGVRSTVCWYCPTANYPVGGGRGVDVDDDAEACAVRPRKGVTGGRRCGSREDVVGGGTVGVVGDRAANASATWSVRTEASIYFCAVENEAQRP